jgi:C4-dicarboxylate transporter DctQ subunit
MKRLPTLLRHGAEGVAAGLLAVIFVAFILQIALRYVFDWPVGWTAELSLVAWLWLVLWGAAFVLRDEEEIRIELLDMLAPGRLRLLAQGLGSLAIVVLFGMSLPASWDYVSFMKVEKTSYLKIRVDVLYAIYIVFVLAVIGRHLWLLGRIARTLWRGAVHPVSSDPT